MSMCIVFQHFIEPFVHPSLITSLVHEVKKCFSEQLMLLRGWNTKLHLSLDIHAPSLLLPQKLASPNLIIFNLGKNSNYHNLRFVQRFTIMFYTLNLIIIIHLYN